MSQCHTLKNTAERERERECVCVCVGGGGERAVYVDSAMSDTANCDETTSCTDMFVFICGQCASAMVTFSRTACVRSALQHGEKAAGARRPICVLGLHDPVLWNVSAINVPEPRRWGRSMLAGI